MSSQISTIITDIENELTSVVFYGLPIWQWLLVGSVVIVIIGIVVAVV